MAIASPLSRWHQELARTEVAVGTLLLPALLIPSEQTQPRVQLLLRTGEHPRPDHGDQTPPKIITSLPLQVRARVPATSSLKARIKYRVYNKPFPPSFLFFVTPALQIFHISVLRRRKQSQGVQS